MTGDNFQHGFAEVNKIRLHYASYGKGPLMMFLHGFPEFWAAWESQLIEFGSEYRAVAPDLRGFNLSSKPGDPGQYNINYLIADILGLIDHLEHERMILVAHDWGGSVAWTFAVKYPERLEKLVIINSPHTGTFARELLENPAQFQASQYMNMFRKSDAEEIISQNNFAYLKEALFEGQSKWEISDELLRRYIEVWSQPGTLTGGLNYYRASFLHPPETDREKEIIRKIADLPKENFMVKVPTLVLWGEQDEALLPGLLCGLEEYVNDLTVKRIGDGSHWVAHEQPKNINKYIREFID
jgi:pimeloyl-ACP methyl ester carboxylesterase